MVEFKEVRGTRGNLKDLHCVVRYEIENFKAEPVMLDIIEQMNRVAREFVGDPHGDAEWELRGKTSDDIRFTHEYGAHNPVLHVQLPPRPKDQDKKVEKKVVRFHFVIKNVW